MAIGVREVRSVEPPHTPSSPELTVAASELDRGLQLPGSQERREGLVLHPHHLAASDRGTQSLF